MNTLSYQSTDQHGLSFELMIDGRSLGELLGSGEGSNPLPFWLFVFEHNVPDLPQYSPSDDPELRIVAVCSCGETGCGLSLCRVVHKDGAVVLRDFEGDLGAEAELNEFRFSPVNYSEVFSAIIKEAHEYKGRT